MKLKNAALLLSGCLALTAAGESLVSDPGRTAAVERKPIMVLGRDYWYLTKGIWRELDGVRDEPFIKESGLLSVKWNLRWKNLHPPRVLYLRDLKVYGQRNGRTRPVEFKLEMEKCEPDTKIYQAEKLTDGDPDTVCAVSGSIASVSVRYAPVEVKLNLRFDSPLRVRRLILNYGTKTSPEIGEPEFWCNGKKLKAKVLKEHGTLSVYPDNAPESDSFTVLCRSSVPKVTLADFPPEQQELLLTRPFASHLMRPVPFGLTPDNFDRAECERILRKYDKSHIGICFAEWDSQAFFQSLNPGSRLYAETTAFFGQPPSDRTGMVNYLSNFWQWHREIFFDRIWGLSGSTGMVHYGMEWGGLAAGMELTNHTSTIPHRTFLRYTAGAGRQYGRPWLHYQTYYLGKLAANSEKPPAAKNAKNWGGGPDAGISPSFARRMFLSGYFMGNTYQSFESEPWGQAEKKNGTVVLNANGKVLKEFYEWTRSPEGKRGTWYTPILLAIDWQHGMIRDDVVWGWHETRVEQTKGDLMGKHFNWAIDPYDGEREAWNKPPYSHNLHNGPLGDVFDTQIGNPPSGILPEFRNYAVVVLPDAIRITPGLSAKLADYVSGGGTLVINSIHRKSLPREMMTAEILPETVADSGLKIPKVKPGKTRPAFRTDAGNVLAVRQEYGKGAVIMTLPEYFLGEDKVQPNRYIGRLLEALQREVLPFRIEGDCQFIISQLGTDHWKLALLNNKGVLKEPWERKERFDHKYDAKIAVALPKGAQAKAVYRKRELKKTSAGIELTLPAGEVTVLEIRGAAMKPALTGKIVASIPPQKRELPAYHPVKPAPTPEMKAEPRKDAGDEPVCEWPLDGTPGKARVGKVKEQQFEVKYAALPSGRKVYDASARTTAISVSYRPNFKLTELTMELWAAPNFKAKLSDRGGYPLAARYFRFMFTNRRWLFNALDAITLYGPEAKDGQWDHLAFTWDGRECRFFVNGVEYTRDGGVPLKLYLPVWNGDFDIGTLGRGRRTFGGKISAVKLYGTALSPEKIREHYEQTKNQYKGK